MRFYFYVPDGVYQLQDVNKIKEALVWYPDIIVGGLEWNSDMNRLYNGKVRLAWISNTPNTRWKAIQPVPMWNVADLICSKLKTGDSVTCQNEHIREGMKSAVRTLLR